MREVYLDYASTTPMDPRVIEVMCTCLRKEFGNPSSLHRHGRQARRVVEESRERVAGILGAAPSEIIFTGGATESDNQAILGFRNGERTGLVTTSTEHKAVLQAASVLKTEGRRVVMVDPPKEVAVTKEVIEAAATDEVGLVSVMLVNNEVGTIAPVSAIASACHRKAILMHTDAAQAAGHMAIEVNELGVDLMSLSGHKIRGPKGVGVLYVRSGVQLRNLLFGGGQEAGRRAGTENVAAIAGFAKALELATVDLPSTTTQLQTLKSRMLDGLRAVARNQVYVNTPSDTENTSPHILSVAFRQSDGEWADGQRMVATLDKAGVSLSTGSACASGAIEPSHVLTSMGFGRDRATASVRFSFGKETSPEDVDHAVQCVSEALALSVPSSA